MQLTLAQAKELDELRVRAGATGGHRSVKRIARDAQFSEEAVRGLFLEAWLIATASKVPPACLRANHRSTLYNGVMGVL
jgi:hypothetical protein